MTNRWSKRRKRLISLLVLVALFIFVGVPAYLLFYKAPTCLDGKQNGDETGVDCGGSCQLICAVESLPLVQEGDARVLTVAPNVYEVVALFDNPNVNAEVYRASYTIELYATGNPVPARVIKGSTFIPKNSSFAIFEGPFNLLEVIPVRATFSWDEGTLVWEKRESALPEVNIQSKELVAASTSPRLSVTVFNRSLEAVNNLELIVMIYDVSGNIFASSKTFIDTLAGGVAVPAVFTWPRGFDREVGLIDVIPRALPDRSFIR